MRITEMAAAHKGKNAPLSRGLPWPYLRKSINTAAQNATKYAMVSMMRLPKLGPFIVTPLHFSIIVDSPHTIAATMIAIIYRHRTESDFLITQRSSVNSCLSMYYRRKVIYLYYRWSESKKKQTNFLSKFVCFLELWCKKSFSHIAWNSLLSIRQIGI